MSTIPVLATWVIRSGNRHFESGKLFLYRLQTIVRRQSHKHALSGLSRWSPKLARDSMLSLGERQQGLGFL